MGPLYISTNQGLTWSQPSGGPAALTRVVRLLRDKPQVFEDDGYRSWRYAQYFSAALHFDDVDAEHVTGSVYLALPDSGKSMLAGAFDAKRCPSSEERVSAEP